MSKDTKHIAFISNCTQASSTKPLLRISDAPKVATMDELLQWWTHALQDASSVDTLMPLGSLYTGLSFDTVIEIAQVLGHENVFIVNRGAGLVRLNQKIVPYDFTYDRKEPDSAYSKVTDERFMPRLWWAKINQALHNEPHPIANLKTEDGEDYDHIVIALPKNFIKMVASDIECAPNKVQRIFIPTPISFGSGIPRAIRQLCIPYTKAYTYDLDYTRYSKAQRVAQKFLLEAMELGNFTKHANAIRDAQHALEDKGSTGMSHEDIFEAHPELLKCETVQGAMSLAKMHGLRIGSRIRFTGAWHGAKGALELDPDKDELKTAADSLRSIMSSMPSRQIDSEELLQQIGLFVLTVKKENPTLIFTSAEVSSWGKLVYTKGATITSSGKVAGILRAYTSHLGLEQFRSGSKYLYRIAT